MMTAEVAERSNTYPQLRSRVAACVAERMIQQSCAPMDVGEVEGEAESSDVQIDEGAAKRLEVATSRRTREAVLESAAIGWAREARSRQRSGYREVPEEEETGNGMLLLRRKGTASETGPDTSSARHPSC